ncbi:MAG: NADH-quinone oxidoreductase subunit M [Coriobacteriia bacterium]|nr:NADH-quinone oxidoreductase subunit M [Coriobacteriia bacterium]
MLRIDLLILLPLAGAVLTAMAGSRARLVALATTLATIGVAVSLIPHGLFAGLTLHGLFEPTDPERAWLLTADGISAPLLALTLLLGVVAVLASWNISDRPATHHALLLGLQAAVTGVFLAEHVVLFYVFWEAVLIPMYFLIGGWGHENRRHAATKFFIYTFAGSALMLIGLLIAIYTLRATTFSALADAGGGFPHMLVYWLLLAGLLVKIPVVPLHTWLPDAHVEAPTAGSIMLAGVLLKMGGYGMIRLAMPLATDAWEASRPLLLALGVVGVIYGAVTALVQTDLKRLVAYSSVSHMGFVLIALSVGTPAALQAAMLVMVSHGLVAGLLFLLVGELYDRAHTRELARFGGLGAVTPVWATAFTFAALASLGLPGLSGFPGELLAVLEGFGAWSWSIAPVGVGLLLAAAYNLRAVRAVSHGSIAEEFSTLPDLDARAIVAVLLLVIPVIVLGLWPRLIADIPEEAFAVLGTLLRAGVTP